MVKYSIIVPVFNKENNLLATLDSINNQTLKDFEVVIINDGSTDRSLDIIKNYDFRNLNYKIHSKKNAGVSAARNDGLALSSGEYIIFNDADDIIYPNFLAEFDKVFTDKAINIAYCFRDLTSPKKISLEFAYKAEGNVLKEYLLSKIRPATNGFVISRDFIKNNAIKFDEDLNWGEDILFFSKLLFLDNSTRCLNQHLILKDNSLENSLSALNIDMVDKDHVWMERLLLFLSAHQGTLSDEAISIIKGYRFPAAAINLFINLIQTESKDNINAYYLKYKSEIDKISNVNGIRSILLKYKYWRLKNKLLNNNI